MTNIISSILYKNDPVAYYKLCILISKFINSNDIYGILYKLFRKKRTDIEYLQILSPYIKVVGDSSKYLSIKYINLIKTYKKNYKTYLDFGCGKCTKTKLIGDGLGLKQSQIYGTDIIDQFEKDWTQNREEKINFEYITNNKIPFKEKFDIISCFMVLHHIKDLYPILENIVDHMNDNAVLIIRDHNCKSNIDNNFADIMHQLYMLNKEPYEEIIKQRFYYNSAYSLKKKLETLGLKEIYFSQTNFSVTNNYDAIYIKLTKTI